METVLTWLAVTLAGLIVSARTVVHLPVLGPEPVLGVVAVAVVLAIAGAVLLIARGIVRDWPAPGTVPA